MAGIKKVGPSAYVYDDEHVDELELAKGHAYALVLENDRLKKEIARLTAEHEQQRIALIKAGRENGNLYAALERLQDGPYDEQTAEMFALTQEMNEQECEIVLMVARKLVGEGKEEHGSMRLQDDERDLLGEALDEVTDGLTYVLMRLLKGRL